VEHSRYPEGAADHRQAVVPFPYGQLPPGSKVVELAVLVQSQRRAAEKEHDPSPHGGDAHGCKVAIQEEHGHVEHVSVEPGGRLVAVDRTCHRPRA
jgi:hypothetical protein